MSAPTVDSEPAASPPLPASNEPTALRDELRFVIVCVDEEEFAIPMQRVREVRALPMITRIPGSAPYVRGLIDVHGDPVPTVDLRIRLNHQSGGPPARSLIVVVEIERAEGHSLLALVGDSLKRVHRAQRSELVETNQDGKSADRWFCDALLRTEDSALVVLAIDKLLPLAEGERRAA